MLRPTPGLPKPRGQRAKVMIQLGEGREQEPQCIRTSVHKPNIQEKRRDYHESRLLFFQVRFLLGGPRQNPILPGHSIWGICRAEASRMALASSTSSGLQTAFQDVRARYKALLLLPIHPKLWGKQLLLGLGLSVLSADSHTTAFSPGLRPSQGSVQEWSAAPFPCTTALLPQQAPSF